MPGLIWDTETRFLVLNSSVSISAAPVGDGRQPLSQENRPHCYHLLLPVLQNAFYFLSGNDLTARQRLALELIGRNREKKSLCVLVG